MNPSCENVRGFVIIVKKFALMESGYLQKDNRIQVCRNCRLKRDRDIIRRTSK